MRINCNKYKIQKTFSPVTHWTFRSSDISPRAENIHKLTSYIMHMCHNSQYKSHFPMKTVSEEWQRIGYGPSADGYDQIVITECVSDAL